MNTSSLKIFSIALFSFATGVFLNCQASRTLAGSVLPFQYSSIDPLTIGYCPPIVTESTIFYENRYTDQNYHSIDTKRTEDAFLRDLKYVIREKKVAWREMDDSLAILVHGALCDTRAPLDSLPGPIRKKLTRAKLEYAFVVYDVRLTHTQLVGTTGTADSAHNGSFGPGIHRKLSYKCSLINIVKNIPVYFKEINKEDTGTKLDLVEKTLRILFHEMMKY